MTVSKQFALAALAVALTVTIGLAHSSSSLTPPDGGAARGEARLDDDDLRVRGDRLPSGVEISIAIEVEGGDFAEAFATTTEDNGSFDVRARSRNDLPLGASDLSEFSSRRVEVRVSESGEVLLAGNFPGTVRNDELGVGTATLEDVTGIGVSGRTRVKASNGRQLLEVKVRGLAEESVFSVDLTSAAGETENVGSITTNGDGNGTLKIDTEDGATLPFGAGAVADIVGFLVEVSNEEGEVLLRGVVPAIGQNDRDVGEIEVEFDLRRPDDAPEPGIRGDVNFETEPQRDRVRVRLREAMANSNYMARITREGAEGEEPMREQIAMLMTDGDGEAEEENRGRPILPFGAGSIAELSGDLVEIFRLDEGAMVLVLSGSVPDAPDPGDPPPPGLPLLTFVVTLMQPAEPVLPLANGKVEFQEQDDEHEIEVEVEDLTPEAAYRVEVRGADAVSVLFDGAADEFGDVRRKIRAFGGEAKPLGVASFSELDGAEIVLLDADGATVLSAIIDVPGDPDDPGDPNVGGGGGVAAEISFVTIGDYDTRFLRGDANDDGVFDIADPIYALGVLFVGQPVPVCQDTLDFNDDGGNDISDPVFGLLHLFSGGAPPPAPGVSIRGFDLTPDDLYCED